MGVELGTGWDDRREGLCFHDFLLCLCMVEIFTLSKQFFHYLKM